MAAARRHDLTDAQWCWVALDRAIALGGPLEATATRLGDERGLGYRYKAADGLEGEEAPPCSAPSFWLAQAKALAGEVDEARAAFERAVAWGVVLPRAAHDCAQD